MDYIIKPMETDEEIRGKAYVHWKSWQEAYRGIVDAGYLEHLTLETCLDRAYRYPENILVAKAGDAVVGFAAAGKYRSASEEASDEGEVYALYVLEAYQKQKVGYELMRRCLTKLSDCRVIYVWVLRDNAKAIAFYEKVGFRKDGAEKELMLGTPISVIRMAYQN